MIKHSTHSIYTLRATLQNMFYIQNCPMARSKLTAKIAGLDVCDVFYLRANLQVEVVLEALGVVLVSDWLGYCKV